ncbi:MAG: hypothetical protein [Bacteriophage sp.]|nr:MAG: hypothetical protein [Bacteriophage sp.]
MSRRVVTVALTDDAWSFYSQWPRGKRSHRVCSSIIMHEINTTRRKDMLAAQKDTERELRKLRRQNKDLEFRLNAVTMGLPDPGANEWGLK